MTEMREYDFQPGGREMLTLALYGFHGAMLRFENLAKKGDQLVGFVAATEAIWWACTIDEQLRQRPDRQGVAWYEKQREEHTDGRVIRGLIYARNRATHALPMTVDEQPAEGDRTEPAAPVLVWQPLDALPDPPADKPDKEGRKRYASELAGKDVRDTLRRAAGWFASVQNDVRANFGDPLPSTVPPWDDGRD